MYVRDFDNIIDSSTDSILSILLHDDSVFCAVIGQDHTMQLHKSFLKTSYADPASTDAIKADKLFQRQYKDIIVSVLNQKYFFLPDKQPDIDHLVDSLKYKEVFVDKMAGIEVYNHFGISHHQLALIEALSHGQSYKMHHIANVFALYYLHQEGKIIHVHVEQNELHIYIQLDGKFAAYRCVEATSIEDILYFILAFYKEFGLDTSRDKLVLSGWLEANSPLFTQIYGYVAKVHWVDDSTFRLTGESPDAAKDHFYFAHFANSLCVS